MNNMKLASFVLILVLVSISCSLFTPTSSKSSSDIEVVDFVSPAETLNVTVKLDEVYSTSEMIPSNGGSIFLTAADGSEFTLDIPADALETDTLITMTAVESIEGAPLDDGPVAAVQLEPSGLFFNEIVTLTIVPAQEIPIENQIIFGYEGDGQDYHLAIVDPQSREIKVKLMGFSGAGVGSGSDTAWAANLQVQANATRVQLDQKLGEYTQGERQDQLLGSEGNPENSKIIRSYLEQIYDQVIRKEMAAAELDCRYAKKARQDLLALERTNQLLVLSGQDSQGYPNPFLDDIWEKIEKLAKIEAECTMTYRVNDEKFSGRSWVTQCIPSLDGPYQISWKSPEGTGEYSFTPDTGNWNSGKAEIKITTSIGVMTSTQEGEGTYVITVLSKDSEGNPVALSIDYNVKGTVVQCIGGDCITTEVPSSEASVPITVNDKSCK